MIRQLLCFSFQQDFSDFNLARHHEQKFIFTQLDKKKKKLIEVVQCDRKAISSRWLNFNLNYKLCKKKRKNPKLYLDLDIYRFLPSL